MDEKDEEEGEEMEANVELMEEREKWFREEVKRRILEWDRNQSFRSLFCKLSKPTSGATAVAIPTIETTSFCYNIDYL
ncbi:hypothetical protein Csa_017839 [Cucumis sativus]|uniref:Uncharacterized protein n=1 Tax=Cucumis sativus TaxID=3659 RepID=A0A0A0KJK5_CUCSA|nr:hypothetical protein Csa_017839 [Cucumis sativus]